MKGPNDQKHPLTTDAGRPLTQHERENSMTVGPRGPVLLQDYTLQEILAHFNRERIPERVVHAKGGGAYGTFTVTNDITKYTKASVFAKIGKQTRVFMRMSTVAGEKGSADTERDPRGFAIKFYTDEGNWDMVGNNTPIFFIKDPKKFPDFIHSQKRDPHTNLRSATMQWDFWSLNPESLHQVIILMSDRGTPYTWRNMHGFGSHTYSFVNEAGDIYWVKFHFKTLQGIVNMTNEEAAKMKAVDLDFHQRDLVRAIAIGEYPRWRLEVQIMTPEQARTYRYNPFDLTKTWSHKDFPPIEVGILELNELPENYFETVEQASFAPSNIVPGIDFSPDKMLQGRIFAYADAARYRLGANFATLPVNRPAVPVTNYQRDGFMAFNGNGGARPNYTPNSFDNPQTDPKYAGPARKLESELADWYDRNAPGEDDHYSQPRALYRDVMTETDREHLVHNIVEAMKGIDGPARAEIILRQMKHFREMDADFAERVAKGLGLGTDKGAPTRTVAR